MVLGNIDFASLINDLAIYSGILPILISIFNFFHVDYRYGTDVIIKQITSECELRKLKCYHSYWESYSSQECFLIYSKSGDIRKINLISLRWDKDRMKEDHIIKSYTNIMPNEGILLYLDCPCGIPKLKVSWMLNYGVKGEYTFAENGMTGNKNMEIFNYKMNCINKIRKHLNWK